jgi:phosphoribosylformylglycinamidine synthase
MTRDGRLPTLDLILERAVQSVCLRANEEGLLRSAHDCADGGLSIALAESCFSTLSRPAIGASIELKGALSAAAQLFAETPSRIIISFAASARARVEEIAAELNCPCASSEASAAANFASRLTARQLSRNTSPRSKRTGALRSARN